MARSAGAKPTGIHCDPTGKTCCPEHPWSKRFKNGQCKECKTQYRLRKARSGAFSEGNDDAYQCPHGHTTGRNSQGACIECGRINAIKQYHQRSEADRQKQNDYRSRRNRMAAIGVTVFPESS